MKTHQCRPRRVTCASALSSVCAGVVATHTNYICHVMCPPLPPRCCPSTLCVCMCHHQQQQVVVKPASGSNPGIPPSSLMSFLRVKPSLQGAVLAEFDTAFRNPFYASRFDNGSTIDAGSIASAAAVLAAAVHRLAGGDSQLPLQVRGGGKCSGFLCSDVMSPPHVHAVQYAGWPLAVVSAQCSVCWCDVWHAAAVVLPCLLTTTTTATQHCCAATTTAAAGQHD